MVKFLEVKISERLPQNNGIYYVTFINYRGDYDKTGSEFHNGKWNGLPDDVVVSWLEQIE